MKKFSRILSVLLTILLLASYTVNASEVGTVYEDPSSEGSTVETESQPDGVIDAGPGSGNVTDIEDNSKEDFAEIAAFLQSGASVGTATLTAYRTGMTGSLIPLDEVNRSTMGNTVKNGMKYFDVQYHLQYKMSSAFADLIIKTRGTLTEYNVLGIDFQLVHDNAMTTEFFTNNVAMKLESKVLLGYNYSGNYMNEHGVIAGLASGWDISGQGDKLPEHQLKERLMSESVVKLNARLTEDQYKMLFSRMDANGEITDALTTIGALKVRLDDQMYGNVVQKALDVNKVTTPVAAYQNVNLTVLNPETSRPVYNEIYNLYDSEGRLQGSYKTKLTGKITVQNLRNGTYYFQKMSADGRTPVGNKEYFEIVYDNVSLTFGGASTSEKNLVSLNLLKMPIKMAYSPGDKLNLTGMRLQAVYSDGTTRELASYNASPKNGTVLQITDSVVTLQYTEKDVTVSTSFNIDMDTEAVMPVELVIEKPANKTSFVVGEAFNRSGLQVAVLYADGSKKIVTNYTTSHTVGKAVSEWDSYVYISYIDKGVYLDTGYPISISAQSMKLKNIEIAAPPAKTDYWQGENFSLDGLVVNAVYRDGTVRSVDNYTTNIAEGTVLGRTHRVVSVVYTEGTVRATAQFNINVNAVQLESIELTSLPLVTNYLVKERMSTNGLEVVAHYSNGSSKVVSNFVTSPVNNAYIFKAGEIPVTVRYSEGGKSASTSYSIFSELN